MKKYVRYSIITFFFFFGVIAGCDQLDSNWDTSWWKQDRRIVKPTQRPQPRKRETAKTNPETPDKKSDTAVASSEQSPANADDSKPLNQENNVVRRASNSTSAIRPFYHLYLVPDGSKAAEGRRNEARVTLRHLSPRLCGMLLEMLYVPLGRSGSGGDTYLIYEQPEEFERAMTFVEHMDRASVGDAWSEGIAGYLKTLEQGVIVDKDLIESSEKKFASIVQNGGGADEIRWAAGIFAGKLAADYRYAYADARSYYAQSLRFAKEESIEAMTAEWWRANTFTQESATKDANEAYEDILDHYTHLWPKSHVIERSYAILKKNQKR
jgi:hypothetical protein